MLKPLDLREMEYLAIQMIYCFNSLNAQKIK